MSRNIKALGIALVAAFAMSAVVASGASAQAFKFKSEGTPTKLTGTQHAGNDVFVTDAGSVSCSEANYSGEQVGTEVSEVTVTPSYSGCTAFGFVNVPIHVNGCQYKFTAITKEGANFEGAVDIVCPAGKVIEVTAPLCTVTIGSQNNLKKVTYTNVGSGTTREVTVDVAITGITYVEHRSSIFSPCPSNTVTKTNGTYNGAGLVTGSNAGVHRGIWVE